MVRYSFLSLAAIGILLTPQAFAAEELSQDKVKQLIAEYIQEHPEEILQSLDNYQLEQARLEEEVAQQALAENMEFFDGDGVPTVGNPDADIHVVEFYDYNCGYCKRAFSDVAMLLEEDENVKVTLVDMPILGPSSQLAAEWSLAAKNQGADKFFEFHSALMKNPGTKNEGVLEMLAEKAGLDVEQLKKDLEDPEIVPHLDENKRMAAEIGVRGTPAFIVNGELFRGYLGYDGLKAVIKDKRDALSETES